MRLFRVHRQLKHKNYISSCYLQTANVLVIGQKSQFQSEESNPEILLVDVSKAKLVGAGLDRVFLISSGRGRSTQKAYIHSIQSFEQNSDTFIIISGDSAYLNLWRLSDFGSSDSPGRWSMRIFERESTKISLSQAHQNRVRPASSDLHQRLRH